MIVAQQPRRRSCTRRAHLGGLIGNLPPFQVLDIELACSVAIHGSLPALGRLSAGCLRRLCHGFQGLDFRLHAVALSKRFLPLLFRLTCPLCLSTALLFNLANGKCQRPACFMCTLAMLFLCSRILQESLGHYGSVRITEICLRIYRAPHCRCGKQFGLKRHRTTTCWPHPQSTT